MSQRETELITQLLQGAKVERQTIQELERQHFPENDVRRAVEQAYLQQGSNRQNAEQQATLVVQQIQQMKGSSGGAAQGLSQRDSERIAQLLLGANVDRQTIAELQRQDFPPDQVERAVEQAYQQAGGDRQRAQQEARQIAQQVRMIKMDAGTLPASAATGVRQVLERIGVDPQRAEQLEQRGFPKDELRQAVRQAFDERAELAIEELENAIERMKAQQEQREGQGQQGQGGD